MKTIKYTCLAENETEEIYIRKKDVLELIDKMKYEDSDNWDVVKYKELKSRIEE